MSDIPIYKQLLISSRNQHQRLVDAVKPYTDEQGYIYISKVKLAKILGCSTTLVNQYFTRLGLYDPCIEQIGVGAFRLKYTDLENRGLFHMLELCMSKIEKDSGGTIDTQTFYHALDTKEKALYLGISGNEVQILDGYINKVFTGFARGKVNRYVRKRKKV